MEPKTVHVLDSPQARESFNDRTFQLKRYKQHYCAACSRIYFAVVRQICNRRYVSSIENPEMCAYSLVSIPIPHLPGTQSVVLAERCPYVSEIDRSNVCDLLSLLSLLLLAGGRPPVQEVWQGYGSDVGRHVWFCGAFRLHSVVGIPPMLAFLIGIG